MTHDSARLPGITRRGALGSLAAGAVGVGIGVAGAELPRDGVSSGTNDRVRFHARHQAGIATPPPSYVHFATFDLAADTSEDLRALLQTWTQTARKLTAGQRSDQAAGFDGPPPDTGEALDLTASRLTVTIGLGPDIFERDGEDRLGLRNRKPAALEPLPAFPGDALTRELSGGDLCIQACADDQQVAFHAVHTLGRAAADIASVRWSQAGFRPTASASRAAGSHRNLMGFKEGTQNVATSDTKAMARHVWANSKDGQPWMNDGTYLVARRIRMLLDVWDATTLSHQEAIIGRHKATGAPLGRRRELDRVDLQRNTSIPRDAHIRLAAPETNNDAHLHRRSYSYSNGVDQDTGQLDAGLLFICFQRDPRRQFVPIQLRLADHDALNEHILHTGSALFACPAGPTPNGFIGERLFQGA